MTTAHILALSSFAWVCAVVYLGVGYVKAKAQDRKDKNHQNYLVICPMGTEFKQVQEFTRSLSGNQTSKLDRFANGVYTCVSEVEGQENGIRFWLGVPHHQKSLVTAQLRSHIPGAVAEPSDRPDHQWDRAVELVLTANKPIRIGSPDGTVNTLLAPFSTAMAPGLGLLLQIVYAPAIPIKPETKDEQEKESEPTFDVVIRLAARGDQADRLLASLRKAIGSMSNYGVRFRSSWLPETMVIRRIKDQAGPLRFGSRINAMELATLMALSANGTNTPGIPQGRARPLVAHSGIPREGAVIGLSNFFGAERPVALIKEKRRQHTLIIGGSGGGKSTLMKNLAAYDIASGAGCIVLDPHGDMVREIEDLIPQERIDRGEVAIFDPAAESNRKVGINVLGGSDPHKTLDRTMSVLDNQLDIRDLHRTRQWAAISVLTLAMKGYTIMDMPLLLQTGERGRDFRHQLTKDLKGTLKHEWMRFEELKDTQKAENTSALMNRLAPLVLREPVKAAFGQANPGLDINNIVREGKVLLVNLNKGLLGEETSGLFAGLIFSQIWQAVLLQAELPPDQRKTIYIHVDELHRFAGRSSVSLADIFQEGRKYGAALNVALQSSRRLSPDVVDALLTNTAAKIIFRTASNEATALARECSPYLSADDISNLPDYEAVVRLAGLPPATIRTSRPPRPLGTARAARAASDELFGVPREQVERELNERQRVVDTPRVEAPVGRVEEEDV